MNFAIYTAYCTKTFRRLRDEEDGLALTEYLLLLGLLVGGIILAVQGFGTALNTGWAGWSDWLTDGTDAGGVLAAPEVAEAEAEPGA